MQRKPAKKPRYQQEIALERIKELFRVADKVFRSKPEQSHRYIGMARQIAMRHNVRIPKELKRRICKKCHKYIVPSINSRVRTSPKQGTVIVKCLECGFVMRYPYRKEKQKYA